METLTAYIPTRGTDRLVAHKFCERFGIQYYLCCDSLEQKQRILEKHKVDPEQIVVLGTPEDWHPLTGIALVRETIALRIMPKGVWSLWIDDNVYDFTCLPKPSVYSERIDPESVLTYNGNETSWREAFKHPATREDLAEIIGDTITKAEEVGTIFAGFATENNHFFRFKKWQYWGYVRTQFALYKNDRSSWLDHRVPQLMFEDFLKSVDVVARYGKVLINRYGKPVKQEFQEGGIGSLERRIPWLEKNCRDIRTAYEGLVDYSKGRSYHLTFTKRSQRTVDAWRRQHGFLR